MSEANQPNPTIEYQSQPVGTPPQPKKRGGVLIAACLASALVGGLAGGSVMLANYPQPSNNESSNSSTVSVSETATSDLSDIINAALASVVTVGVDAGNAGGSGSGVVLNDEGYIVTNAHVVTLEGLTDAASITVQTSSGDTYVAELVGLDSTADIAVLKVDNEAAGLTPIQFASSSDLSVGDTTIAIGSPLGLSGTVTTGVVSALNRPILVANSEVDGSRQQPSTSISTIQTDAAINSGSSGGALLDGNGNLIGVNVAISSTAENSGSIGIGYAIPSDYVQRIVDEIIETGSASHGTLGVEIADADNGTGFPAGARVMGVTSGSPASESGLRENDVITKVDDNVIASSGQLTAVIKQYAPGTEVTLSYQRNDEEQSVTVVLS